MQLKNLKPILIDQDEVVVCNYAKKKCSTWSVGHLLRQFPELPIIKITAEKSKFVLYTAENFAEKLTKM